SLRLPATCLSSPFKSDAKHAVSTIRMSGWDQVPATSSLIHLLTQMVLTPCPKKRELQVAIDSFHRPRANYRELSSCYWRPRSSPENLRSIVENRMSPS